MHNFVYQNHSAAYIRNHLWYYLNLKLPYAMCSFPNTLCLSQRRWTGFVALLSKNITKVLLWCLFIIFHYFVGLKNKTSHHSFAIKTPSNHYPSMILYDHLLLLHTHHHNLACPCTHIHNMIIHN